MPNSAYVLTRNKINNDNRTHSSFTHFLDLVDACGFTIKIGALLPTSRNLRSIKICFIDAEYCKSDVLLGLPIVREYPALIKVIFNANADHTELHYAALKLGISGVFNKRDPLELVIRGIQQVKAGKKWFSRDLMDRFISELLTKTPFDERHTLSNDVLTKRERAITQLIIKGAQNQEIANELHISVNTVKTHIYSIFRKTECRNRIGLIKWYTKQSTH